MAQAPTTSATPSPTARSPQPITIIFPLFDGITQLDFTGPAQFLSRLPGARIVTAAREVRPITTDSGFAIVPGTSFADCPPADILCVPGGHGIAEAVGCADTVAFVARQAATAQWVTSVCTGAFLLGAAGLLKGKQATTHWGYTHLLPLVGAVPTPGRVVEDGQIITAGGVTSGIDFALTLIARIAGQPVAEAIQLALEYDPAPPTRSGHPSVANDVVLSGLKTRVYDAAAARMAAALALTGV